MVIGIKLITDGPCMELTKELFELIFPKGSLTDLSSRRPERRAAGLLHVDGKNLPPISNTDLQIVARKFHDVTITDFPLRGKRTRLTFRRRYWKLDGQAEYLNRAIPLCFPAPN